MILTSFLILFFAGVAGGLANAIAGGATLITFPAMLAVGLPPIVANASNAVAVIPGHLVAAISDRAKLPPLGWLFVLDVLVACLGGIVGAAILLNTSERLFTHLVPALIGFATLLFALSNHIQTILVVQTKSPLSGLKTALLAPIATYGGYFGAGAGIMLLALLSVTAKEDIRQVNVSKNLLATAISLAAIAVFIANGTVKWPETLIMLAGAVCGGFLGGRLIAILSPQIVRKIIIVVGTTMTALYGWRYWLN